MKTKPLLSLLIVVALTACGQKAETAAPPEVVAAPVPAPVAAPAPVPVVAAASAADLAIGEKVYTATCAACHTSAVMGAPKLGDKPSWTPRITKGINVLYTSSTDGLKLMPARGGNAALKDDELKAAVDYMVSKAM